MGSHAERWRLPRLIRILPPTLPDADGNCVYSVVILRRKCHMYGILRH